jgi:alkylation response protein AidB-like acyl-CoA dehydrogenase
MIQGKRIILPACEDSAITAQAAAADAFVMSDEVSLYLVEASDVPFTDHQLVDGGRGANVMFCQVSANRIGDAPAIVEAATAAGLVALCAEAVAIMDVIRDQTLEYLRTRKQFGQPIGQFQVLKHRMATVALEIEQARSAATNAAALLEGERIARERAVSAAKFTIGRAGILVAEEAIQMHGGIGMTWELPLSHYAKRLVMIGHLLGDEDHHLDRYIALGRKAA